MTSGGIHQGAQVVVATIMAIAALSIASSVFAPVAFALFIIALVWPLQKALQAFLPRLLALAVSVGLHGLLWLVMEGGASPQVRPPPAKPAALEWVEVEVGTPPAPPAPEPSRVAERPAPASRRSTCS